MNVQSLPCYASPPTPPIPIYVTPRTSSNNPAPPRTDTALYSVPVLPSCELAPGRYIQLHLLSTQTDSSTPRPIWAMAHDATPLPNIWRIAGERERTAETVEYVVKTAEPGAPISRAYILVRNDPDITPLPNLAELIAQRLPPRPAPPASEWEIDGAPGYEHPDLEHVPLHMHGKLLVDRAGRPTLGVKRKRTEESPNDGKRPAPMPVVGFTPCERPEIVQPQPTRTHAYAYNMWETYGVGSGGFSSWAIAPRASYKFDKDEVSGTGPEHRKMNAVGGSWDYANSLFDSARAIPDARQ